MRRALLLVSLLLLVIWAVPAQAQTTVINPRTLEFIVSADHATTFEGTPLVTGYEFRVYVESSQNTVAFTFTLGKPTPDAANKVSMTNPVWFADLTPKTKYVGKVVAMGPTGEGVSDPSGPFANVPAPGSPTAVVLKK